jgi:hypothetical protein
MPESVFTHTMPLLFAGGVGGGALALALAAAAVGVVAGVEAGVEAGAAAGVALVAAGADRSAAVLFFERDFFAVVVEAVEESTAVVAGAALVAGGVVSAEVAVFLDRDFVGDFLVVAVSAVAWPVALASAAALPVVEVSAAWSVDSAVFFDFLVLPDEVVVESVLAAEPSAVVGFFFFFGFVVEVSLRSVVCGCGTTIARSVTSPTTSSNAVTSAR